MLQVCGKAFSCKAYMSRHMREMHNITMRDMVSFIPNGNSLSDEDITSKHLRKMPTGKVRCRLCNVELARNETGINHVKRVHMKQKNFQCDQCPARFFDKQILGSHVRRVHSGKIKPKPLKEIDTDIGLKMCMFQEGEGEPLTKCKKCKENNHDKVYPSMESLLLHISQFHLRRKVIKCPYCPHSYNKQQNLDRHIGLEHGDKDPKLRDEVIFIRDNVEKAKRTEDGQVICPLCEKYYSNNASLTSHLKCVHLGRRPQVCEICKDGFQQRGALRLHMKAKHKVDLPVLKNRYKDLSEHNRPNRLVMIFSFSFTAAYTSRTK